MEKKRKKKAKNHRRPKARMACVSVKIRFVRGRVVTFGLESFFPILYFMWKNKKKKIVHLQSVIHDTVGGSGLSFRHVPNVPHSTEDSFPKCMRFPLSPT